MVIFSDESNFQIINRKITPQVRRFDFEKYNSRYVKKRVQGGGESDGIWMCISLNDVGVSHNYVGRLNSALYKEVLENSLKPSIALLYNQDDHILFQ